MKTKEESVNVLPENEYLVERFIRSIYGSPYSWSGGQGLIVKGYPGLSIESRKEFVFEGEGEYKTRIIIGNLNGKIKDKLVHLAKTKNLNYLEELLDIENVTKENKIFEYFGG
jgi:hypothetical protein